MPTPPFLAHGARATLAMCCALIAACATPGPGLDTLTAHGEGFRLQRSFVDFYDTAFVLTQGGTTTPRVVSLDELADALVDYDVVFYGESHRHPGVHLQQQRLFRALYARTPRWILSLEQFERDVQPVIDDYLAGRVGENTLVDKGRAWDNYRPSYRPLVQFAREQQLPVVAAEAPGWAISCIGQLGPEVLDKFTPAERALVARELHLGAGPYRDKYLRFATGSSTHGGGAPSPQAALRAERSYAGQAARDDTMAESIFLALQKFPGRKVLHLNGGFHSAGFLGTPERLLLRNPRLKIAVIDPVEVEDPQMPAFASDAVRGGTALQLVVPGPAAFADGEDQTEWVRKVMSRREANPCKYSPPAPANAASAPSSAAPPASAPAR